MFFQADGSLDRAGGGLGIGLSVAKRLMELHGGRIEGHSPGLGKGSEFTIHLPVSHQPSSNEVPMQQDPAMASTSVPGRRVLIVDDNSDTGGVFTEIIRGLGHEVAYATDGAAALELACEFRPEVALLDIGLPEMSGYELARRLRELPGLETLFLVALTGYGREEDRRAAQDAGFNLHLVKPIDAERLQSLLATLR